MGGSDSKEEKQEAENISNDTSSGFHVLEIHSPTLGAAFFVILLVAAIAVACVYCRRSRGPVLPHHHRGGGMDYHPHQLVPPYQLVAMQHLLRQLEDHRQLAIDRQPALALPAPVTASRDSRAATVSRVTEVADAPTQTPQSALRT